MNTELKAMLETVIQEALQPIREDIQVMKGDIQVMKGDIQSMKEDIQSMKDDIKSLKKDVEILKSDVCTLKNDVETLKSDVGTLKSDIETLKSGQAELNDIVRVIRDRQDETDAKLESMHMDLHKVIGETAALKQGQERQDKILESLALRSLEQETELRHLKRSV
ncbi:hypothetical protein MKY41_06885 [Sporosarcina sp. FSL W7-1349]|uniref:hypothetical protein n=1 Tax=Sporosarcina sp. FSL W7-1349 TaxID=2921561 RepID=UPI0030F58778